LLKLKKNTIILIREYFMSLNFLCKEKIDFKARFYMNKKRSNSKLMHLHTIFIIVNFIYSHQNHRSVVICLQDCFFLQFLYFFPLSKKNSNTFKQTQNIYNFENFNFSLFLKKKQSHFLELFVKFMIHLSCVCYVFERIFKNFE
jgi:hypothetical protein